MAYPKTNHARQPSIDHSLPSEKWIREPEMEMPLRKLRKGVEKMPTFVPPKSKFKPV